MRCREFLQEVIVCQSKGDCRSFAGQRTVTGSLNMPGSTVRQQHLPPAL